MRSTATVFAMAHSSQWLEPSSAAKRLKVCRSYFSTVVDESTTPLGVSATFTGATITTYSNGAGTALLTGQKGFSDYLSGLIAIKFADQTGSITAQASYDGTTNFRQVQTASFGSGVRQQFTSNNSTFLIINLYMRILFVNGGTAQGTFEWRVIAGAVRDRV